MTAIPAAPRVSIEHWIARRLGRPDLAEAIAGKREGQPCETWRDLYLRLYGEALDIWWSAFADWSLEEFKGTATAAVKRASFMPRPGDLMALRRAALPTAGESWAAVLKHLRGGYRSGGLTPEIDRAVAPLGGYRSLAMMPTDELHWQEKRFAEHYGDMAEAGETRESLANTPGWLQIQAHGAKALSKR